jgi:hypothetical protein
MARALTKPVITVRGTNRIRRATPSQPNSTCRTPVTIVAAKRYSTPCSRTSGTISSAMAPVAAEIIAGRPPAMEMMTAMLNEAYRPTFGSTPAISENAIASGMSARATTRPASSSVRGSRHHSAFRWARRPPRAVVGGREAVRGTAGPFGVVQPRRRGPGSATGGSAQRRGGGSEGSAVGPQSGGQQDHDPDERSATVARPATPTTHRARVGRRERGPDPVVGQERSTPPRPSSVHDEV